MTLYVPILKGRMGELRALRELGLDHVEVMTPLVEIPLGAAEIETDDPNFSGLTSDPAKFADDLRKHIAPGRRVIFDATQAPSGGGLTPTVQVLQALLLQDVDVTPTVRPSDNVVDIDALRVAMDAWKHQSACIRLAGDDLDDSDGPLSELIDAVVGRLGRQPSAIDVVIDFGPIGDDQSASFGARIARLVLAELPHLDEWRTLTVAAGGFPADLNAVTPEVLTEIPRHDAAMWRTVRDRVRTRPPAFGDYGVGYPFQTTGAAFAPAPQLRYTYGDSWLIYKGRKRDRRASAQFYDICARMVSAGAVDPELSWGDSYVHDAAGGQASGRGPGNPMIWRAIGTSHHLCYVASHLATLGAP